MEKQQELITDRPIRTLLSVSVLLLYSDIWNSYYNHWHSKKWHEQPLEIVYVHGYSIQKASDKLETVVLWESLFFEYLILLSKLPPR